MEVAKDIGDIYKSLQNFWDSISTAFLSNLIFILLFTLITGIKLISLSRVERAVKSHRFTSFKAVMYSIGLANKISWTVLFLFMVIYLVVFTSLLNIFFSVRIPFVSPEFKEEAFYAEIKPVRKLTVIGKYSEVQPPSLNDLMQVKSRIAGQFGIDTVIYRERTNFYSVNAATQKDLTLYRLSFLSLIIAILIFAFTKTKRKQWKYILRFSAFLVLNIIVLLNLRWWVEQDIENKLASELTAVSKYAEHTYYPTRLYPMELPDSSMVGLYNHIYNTCIEYQKNNSNNFWVSRTSFSKWFFGKRKLDELREKYDTKEFVQLHTDTMKK